MFKVKLHDSELSLHVKNSAERIGCSHIDNDEHESQDILSDIFGVYEGLGDHGWYLKGMTDDNTRKFMTQRDVSNVDVTAQISLEHLMDMKNFDLDESNFKNLWTFECQDSVETEL